MVIQIMKKVRASLNIVACGSVHTIIITKNIFFLLVALILDFMCNSGGEESYSNFN